MGAWRAALPGLQHQRIMHSMADSHWSRALQQRALGALRAAAAQARSRSQQRDENAPSPIAALLPPPLQPANLRGGAAVAGRAYSPAAPPAYRLSAPKPASARAQQAYPSPPQQPLPGGSRTVVVVPAGSRATVLVRHSTTAGPPAASQCQQGGLETYRAGAEEWRSTADYWRGRLSQHSSPAAHAAAPSASSSMQPALAAPYMRQPSPSR